jgi:HPt (histidine-containing phosphotransfer) domain-containing protein
MDPEFDDLRREFLAEARGKVDEMAQALEAGGNGAREKVIYIAHQLKGSGGSYGFRQISTEAAEIEKLAESAAGDWTSEHIHTAQGRLQKLREIITERQRELA